MTSKARDWIPLPIWSSASLVRQSNFDAISKARDCDLEVRMVAGQLLNGFAAGSDNSLLEFRDSF